MVCIMEMNYYNYYIIMVLILGNNHKEYGMIYEKNWINIKQLLITENSEHMHYINQFTLDKIFAVCNENE